MKKRLFTFLLIALSAMTYAQDKGFENDFRIRSDIGIDQYANNSYGLEYIGGYRFSPFAKLGIGTGFSVVTQQYEEVLNFKYRETGAFVPLFVSGRFNFTDKRVSPFFKLNIGYSFFIPWSDYAKINHHTVFIDPAVGIDVALPKGALTFEIGYKYQFRNVDASLPTLGGYYNYSQINFGIGYKF